MHISMLKAKIHQACVTQTELEYDGSCAIDTTLQKAAGVREYEQIHVYNINNGERFSTYIIDAQAGSGTISLNGAAARKASVGDRIIICSYAWLTVEEAADFLPNLVYVNKNNAIERVSRSIPKQESRRAATLKISS